jgi:hypothetical protein
MVTLDLGMFRHHGANMLQKGRFCDRRNNPEAIGDR